ncbi:MAG: aminotransferase class III-fold pyridoxal phosphate-dependent enzyme [Chitinophagales bacterium]|nr:aminotransferase class III-fold pyridoxal phosphate-dependent enzyme [Chitinophagales bacterium]MDW8426990.1 aminotransferase class III-fold pyridoxal phosphate-dependent enzyme [Chitinophagales bacterium]
MNALRTQFFRHLAPTSQQPLLLDITSAQGIYLYDTSGTAYIDLISGISVSHVGHGNKAVVQAIEAQLSRHLHVMVYGEYIQWPQVAYAARLAALLPPNLQTVYFTNSGSEATEGAMKLAKRLTGRFEIVSFRHCYHGSTQGALSIIGDESLRNAFRPLIPGHRLLPYNDVQALQFITQQTAAVFVEPVQAEAGVVRASPEFLKALRQRCSEMGALLVFDECQTGFGRTGRLFCFQQYDVIPDILILAKALGGGLPLGAFISSYERMQALSTEPALGHITTFGGHPLSCAAGLAALNFLLESHLIEQVAEKQNAFVAKLQHPMVRELRSAGLLMALDVGDDQRCRQLVAACREQQLATDCFLFAPHCLRLAPPLTITKDEVDEVCRRLWKAMDVVYYA